MGKGIPVGAAALAGVMAIVIYTSGWWGTTSRSPISAGPPAAPLKVGQVAAADARDTRGAAPVRQSQPDLFREALGLMSRAEAGDAAALHRIAAIYDFCWQYARSPQAFHRDVGLLREIRKDLAANFDQLESRVAAQCGGFVGEGVGLKDVASFSMRAANRGSLAARVNHLARPILSGGTPDSDVAALAAQALRSRDAEAAAALAPLLGPASAGRADALGGIPAGSLLAEAAWNVAACRMGRDCGPQSQAVAQMCLGGGTNCELRSIEEFYRWEILPPADAARLGQIVEKMTKGTGP